MSKVQSTSVSAATQVENKKVKKQQQKKEQQVFKGNGNKQTVKKPNDSALKQEIYKKTGFQLKDTANRGKIIPLKVNGKVREYETVGTLTTGGRILVKERGKEVYHVVSHTKDNKLVMLKDDYAKNKIFYESTSSEHKVKYGKKNYVITNSKRDRHGRMSAIDENGKRVVLSSDGKELKTGYVEAEDQKDNMNDYIAKQTKGKSKAEADKIRQQILSGNSSYSNKGVLRFKASNGEVWYYDTKRKTYVKYAEKEAQAIIKNLDKGATENWLLFRTGLGTDYELLKNTNAQIIDPEVLNKVNKHYSAEYGNKVDKNAQYGSGKYKTAYEAFLASEIGDDEVYQFNAALVKNNAITDQSRRNEILQTNLTKISGFGVEGLGVGVNKRANRMAAADAASTKEDYQALQDAAEEENKKKNYKAQFKGQDALQTYIYGVHDGDVQEIDDFNTTLIDPKEDMLDRDEIVRIKAETGVLWAKKGLYNKAFESQDSDVTKQMFALQSSNGKSALDAKLLKKQAAEKHQDDYLMMARPDLYSEDEIVTKATKLLQGALQSFKSYEDLHYGFAVKTDNNVMQLQATETNDLKTAENLISRAYSLISNNSILSKVKAKMGDNFNVLMKKEDAHFKTNSFKNVTSITDKQVTEYSDKEGKVKLTPEQIAHNKYVVTWLKSQLADLERDKKLNEAKDGWKQDFVNWHRETYSGYATRSSVANKYQLIKSNMARLEAAAEGKLVDASGKPVSFEDAMKNLGETGIQALEQANADYQTAQQTGEFMVDMAVLALPLPKGFNAANTVIKMGNAFYKVISKSDKACKVIKITQEAIKGSKIYEVATKVATTNPKLVENTRKVATIMNSSATGAMHMAGKTVALDASNIATSREGFTSDRISEMNKKTQSAAVFGGMGGAIGGTTAVASEYVSSVGAKYTVHGLGLVADLMGAAGLMTAESHGETNFWDNLRCVNPDGSFNFEQASMTAMMIFGHLHGMSAVRGKVKPHVELQADGTFKAKLGDNVLTLNKDGIWSDSASGREFRLAENKNGKAELTELTKKEVATRHLEQSVTEEVRANSTRHSEASAEESRGTSTQQIKSFKERINNAKTREELNAIRSEIKKTDLTVQERNELMAESLKVQREWGQSPERRQIVNMATEGEASVMGKPELTALRQEVGIKQSKPGLHFEGETNGANTIINEMKGNDTVNSYIVSRDVEGKAHIEYKVSYENGKATDVEIYNADGTIKELPAETKQAVLEELNKPAETDPVSHSEAPAEESRVNSESHSEAIAEESRVTETSTANDKNPVIASESEAIQPKQKPVETPAEPRFSESNKATPEQVAHEMDNFAIWSSNNFEQPVFIGRHSGEASNVAHFSMKYSVDTGKSVKYFPDKDISLIEYAKTKESSNRGGMFRIAVKGKVSEADAKALMEHLFDKGVIKRDANGYLLTESALKRGNEQKIAEATAEFLVNKKLNSQNSTGNPELVSGIEQQVKHNVGEESQVKETSTVNDKNPVIASEGKSETKAPETDSARHSELDSESNQPVADKLVVAEESRVTTEEAKKTAESNSETYNPEQMAEELGLKPSQEGNQIMYDDPIDGHPVFYEVDSNGNPVKRFIVSKGENGRPFTELRQTFEEGKYVLGEQLNEAGEVVASEVPEGAKQSVEIPANLSKVDSFLKEYPDFVKSEADGVVTITNPKENLTIKYDNKTRKKIEETQIDQNGFKVRKTFNEDGFIATRESDFVYEGNRYHEFNDVNKGTKSYQQILDKNTGISTEVKPELAKKFAEGTVDDGKFTPKGVNEDANMGEEVFSPYEVIEQNAEGKPTKTVLKNIDGKVLEYNYNEYDSNGNVAKTTSKDANGKITGIYDGKDKSLEIPESKIERKSVVEESQVTGEQKKSSLILSGDERKPVKIKTAEEFAKEENKPVQIKTEEEFAKEDSKPVEIKTEGEFAKEDSKPVEIKTEGEFAKKDGQPVEIDSSNTTTEKGANQPIKLDLDTKSSRGDIDAKSHYEVMADKVIVDGEEFPIPQTLEEAKNTKALRHWGGGIEYSIEYTSDFNNSTNRVILKYDTESGKFIGSREEISINGKALKDTSRNADGTIDYTHEYLKAENGQAFEVYRDSNGKPTSISQQYETHKKITFDKEGNASYEVTNEKNETVTKPIEEAFKDYPELKPLLEKQGIKLVEKKAEPVAEASAEKANVTEEHATGNTAEEASNIHNEEVAKAESGAITGDETPVTTEESASAGEETPVSENSETADAKPSKISMFDKLFHRNKAKLEKEVASGEEKIGDYKFNTVKDENGYVRTKTNNNGKIEGKEYFNAKGKKFKTETFDTDGNRTELTEGNVTTKYYANDKVRTVKYPNHKTVEFVYDENGKLTRAEYTEEISKAREFARSITAEENEFGEYEYDTIKRRTNYKYNSDSDKPHFELVDENGKVVTDKNGNPVGTATFDPETRHWVEDGQYSSDLAPKTTNVSRGEGRFRIKLPERNKVPKNLRDENGKLREGVTQNDKGYIESITKDEVVTTKNYDSKGTLVSETTENLTKYYNKNGDVICTKEILADNKGVKITEKTKDYDLEVIQTTSHDDILKIIHNTKNKNGTAKGTEEFKYSEKNKVYENTSPEGNVLKTVAYDVKNHSWTIRDGEGKKLDSQNNMKESHIKRNIGIGAGVLALGGGIYGVSKLTKSDDDNGETGGAAPDESPEVKGTIDGKEYTIKDGKVSVDGAELTPDENGHYKIGDDKYKIEDGKLVKVEPEESAKTDTDTDATQSDDSQAGGGKTGGSASGTTGSQGGGRTGGSASGTTGSQIGGSTGGSTSGTTGSQGGGRTGGSVSGTIGSQIGGSTGGSTSGTTGTTHNDTSRPVTTPHSEQSEESRHTGNTPVTGVTDPTQAQKQVANDLQNEIANIKTQEELKAFFAKAISAYNAGKITLMQLDVLKTQVENHVETLNEAIKIQNEQDAIQKPEFGLGEVTTPQETQRKEKREITPMERMALTESIRKARDRKDIEKIQQEMRQYKVFPGRKNLRRAYKAKLRAIKHQGEPNAQKYDDKFNKRMEKIENSKVYEQDTKEIIINNEYKIDKKMWDSENFYT